MFCAASATAMPPTPSPATSAVMLTPRLSSTSRNTIAQTLTRRRKLTTSSAATVPASSSSCFSRRNSMKRPSPATAQMPNWMSMPVISKRPKTRSNFSPASMLRKATFTAINSRNQLFDFPTT